MCIHLGTKYQHQQVRHPRRLNLPARDEIQKKNNPTLPATVVSELADMIHLSFSTQKSVPFRDVNIWQVGSGSCTYTVSMDIHLQDV
jgi:NADH:ubiquinone oxidoreductase subunit E